MNPHDPSTHEQRLQDALAEYLQEVEAERPPDPAPCGAPFPDLAEEGRALCTHQEECRPRAQPLLPSDQAAATLGTRQPAAAPGTRGQYFGDYELLEEIARGGMGVVYRARQVSLNR